MSSQEPRLAPRVQETASVLKPSRQPCSLMGRRPSPATTNRRLGRAPRKGPCGSIPPRKGSMLPLLCCRSLPTNRETEATRSLREFLREKVQGTRSGSAGRLPSGGKYGLLFSGFRIFGGPGCAIHRRCDACVCPLPKPVTNWTTPAVEPRFLPGEDQGHGLVSRRPEHDAMASPRLSSPVLWTRDERASIGV